MKKNLLAGILAVSMVAALLAGCGKGTAQNTGTAGTQAAADAAAGTEQASTERAKANEIVIGIAQDLDQSLDPHYAVAAGTKEVQWHRTFRFPMTVLYILLHFATA